MIKDKKHSKKLKIVIFNVISAILIVLFWFILYCCFENHWWQCSSEEECLIIHKDIDWDTFNIFAFFIVYFIIELVNYIFTDLPFLHYAVIQVILDWILFCVGLDFMKSTSWLVPTRGINANVEQRMYKAMIQYPYKYNAAMLFSNVIIAIINIINRFLKSRKA